MMKSRLIGFFSIFGFVFCACTLAAEPAAVDVIEKENEASFPSVRVVTLKPEQRTIPIKTSGRIRYGEVRALSFKVAGYVQSLEVNEGEFVKAGVLLARLDPMEVNARLSQIKSLVDKRSADLKRLKSLKAQNLVSDDALESAEQAHAAAVSNWKIAKYDQKHAAIYAPKDSVVVRRPIDPGEYVKGGQTVLELAPVDTGWVVRFGLSDRDLVRLKVGDSATVLLDAWEDLAIKAEVTEIGTQADQQLGTFDVEVKLAAVPVSIRDGFFARVALRPESNRAHYFLPLESVVGMTGREADVMVVDLDGIVSRRTVKPRYLLGDEIAVEKGFEPGDKLVIEGGAWLRHGDRVNIVTDFKLAGR
ncbi:efflux RND transporter periplasmic adaptor subunit [Motiliproteus sp. MSK22-1]|uniref:efflux RND transporter periplasmic adaptor subunit n=1 Tax=Motiliproteus sp. MSK22-1 TaxID=1897630 RepID=UPI0013013655|nr:efflux RND transporter periplasmic adaptor subunit [Motiliproteus sp. MSK22-1]